MFEFDNRDRTLKKGNTVRIIRVPTKGIESCCVLNRDFVHHAVHWFKDRTVPHFDNKHCPYCEDAETLRREVYVPVWIPSVSWVRIVAMTDFAAHSLRRERDIHGSLRGLELKLSKKNDQSAGRIIVECKGYHPLKTHMPDSINVIKHLEYVWQQNMGRANARREPSPGGEYLRKLRN